MEIIGVSDNNNNNNDSKDNNSIMINTKIGDDNNNDTGTTNNNNNKHIVGDVFNSFLSQFANNNNTNNNNNGGRGDIATSASVNDNIISDEEDYNKTKTATNLSSSPKNNNTIRTILLSPMRVSRFSYYGKNKEEEEGECRPTCLAIDPGYSRDARVDSGGIGGIGIGGGTISDIASAIMAKGTKGGSINNDDSGKSIIKGNNGNKGIHDSRDGGIGLGLGIGIGGEIKTVGKKGHCRLLTGKFQNNMIPFLFISFFFKLFFANSFLFFPFHFIFMRISIT